MSTMNKPLRAFTLTFVKLDVYFNIRTYFFYFIGSLSKEPASNYVLYTIFY